MHIPDGYLSPSTCAVMYAGAAPFWYVALKRVRKTLDARLVPMLSLCAAFAFVVMMFNLPLPGGTTGHAVGMCVTTVVLGPWASMLAISVALLIQALFFGDGGITTFGANCFNMAIAGSLVAHFVYQTISGNSSVTSTRRVVAAAVAGYLAINAAALLAALEFGVQPLWFRDASGAPLYAPYPLAIAVPAMMLGHLTFAGFAECAISAGVVAWLQHSNVALLDPAMAGGVTASRSAWRLTRPAWIALGVLMIATPLGLLAAGSAWGEWSAGDFSKAGSRAEIAAASLHVAPPSNPPGGLERLSKIWTAPMPDYAPPFFKSPGFGYLASAMLGVGLVILACLLAEWILGGKRRPLSR